MQNIFLIFESYPFTLRWSHWTVFQFYLKFPSTLCVGCCILTFIMQFFNFRKRRNFSTFHPTECWTLHSSWWGIDTLWRNSVSCKHWIWFEGSKNDGRYHWKWVIRRNFLSKLHITYFFHHHRCPWFSSGRVSIIPSHIRILSQKYLQIALRVYSLLLPRRG